MKFFIEFMDCSIWKDVKEVPFVPTHDVNGVLVRKPKKDWVEDDKENMHRSLKEKAIITAALCLEEFL